MKYDIERIKKLFSNKFEYIFTKEEIDKGYEKIPEIFSVLLKERQSALK
jgi:hypothetical protein